MAGTFDVSYESFENGISTINTLNEKIDGEKDNISDGKTIISEETIFLGPICDSCKEGFTASDSKIDRIVANFSEVKTYLNEVLAGYKKGDSDASKLLMFDSSTGLLSSVSSSGGNTQAQSLFEIGNRAYNGDSTAQKEWLDKMAQIIKPYCAKYNFPESVLLSQIIQESGWTQSKSWLNKNNNILNVNSTMWGSNDYVMSIDGKKNENASIPRWASNPKHASGTVSGGEYFESPREDSMRVYDSVEDCVEDYLALMVGYRPYLNGADVNTAIEGVKHYAEDANYSSKLHNAINKYNLTQYDT